MKHRLRAKLMLACVALGLALGVLESALLVRAGFRRPEAGAEYRLENVYVSNRPLAVFDPVSGFRRTAVETRAVRITHDTLVFDQTFTVNNAGYRSAHDYLRTKDPGTLRLMVLGDSFTSAEYNPTPWPDRVQDALRGRTARPMELYSFAVNGGGLANWSTIFFEDLLPHYDFDALVIAAFGDDLARQHYYLHSDGASTRVGYFPTRAADTEDFYANYLPRMETHSVIRIEVAPDAEIDALIASLPGGWRWPGFQFRSGRRVVAEWRHFRDSGGPGSASADVDSPDGDPGDLVAIQAKYPQFGMLREIMDACRAHGVPVIIASIPGRAGAQAVAESRGTTETPHQRELRAIAEHFGALYMDGYAPFSRVPPEDIEPRYWLQFDGHWNQAGSDLFAGAMTEFLVHAEGQLARQSKP